MTAKMNMKSWYTMRMLKTFFRDVTTQSKTACAGERQNLSRTGATTPENRTADCSQMSASHLEFRKSLDGFKGPQDSQNSEGLYRLDVSSFVVSVDIGNVALRKIAVQSD